MEEEKTESTIKTSGATTPLLLSVPEARKKLGGISKWSLYQLINSRQLESIRIGRRRLIPQIALESFINQRSREDNA
ncbi:DNA binding domain-containing protein, excisionase family [Amycolatopsis lurida]|uniref:helix-turn-helix domain-containing protein n=1 Tax=Amycolatopsis lurida TaxID=31959 RepID=UPI000897EDFD|nr:helix-turn-helix domain-containing protein [Amycolatopsis lurida]SED86114.1 DNA binding domain-containing protein, excisionase family [Amycolatopsis lurida]